MKNRNDLFDCCIIEMGKRVGLEWKTYDDALSYSKQNGSDWYTTKTWTQEEESDFKKWMKSFLKENTNWRMKIIDREISMFILTYGWKTKKEN